MRSSMFVVFFVGLLVSNRADTSAPVTYLDFDGDSTDQQGGGEATVVGQITYAPSASGQAAYFNNVNPATTFPPPNYLLLPNAAGWAPMSVSFSFKPDGTDYQTIAALCSASQPQANGGEFMHIDFSGSFMVIAAALPTTSPWSVLFRSSSTVTAGIWQRVVVTVSASLVVTVYQNGIQTGSQTGWAVPPARRYTHWLIGGSSDGVRSYQGYVDEFKVYNYVLSPDDVWAQKPLPVNYYPASSSPNGFALAQGNLVDIVSLPSVYTLSFDLMPSADGGGWREIMRLDAVGRECCDPGTRIPAVFFCKAGEEVGCPTLGLLVSYLGAPEAAIETTQALPLNTWSTITIKVDTLNLLMSLTVAGGAEIAANTVVLKPTQTTWPRVQVLASEGSYPVAASSIRDMAISSATHVPIVVTPLPITYYPTNNFATGFALSQGNLVDIVSLPSSYTVSFDLNPTAYNDGCRSIVYLNAVGTDVIPSWWEVPGSRLPGAYFCGNSQSDILHVSYLGSPNRAIDSTQALPLGMWSTITISIDTINALMTRKITGGLSAPLQSISIAPTQTTWSRTQVYAAAPIYWPRVAGSIRNLVIDPVTHVDTVVAGMPVAYFPASNYPTGFSLYRGNLLTSVALPASYAVTFDLNPTSDGSGYRSILHLTANGNEDGSPGSYAPGVWFCTSGGRSGTCPTLGLHVIYLSASGYHFLETTQALPIDSWSTVTITVDTINLLMTLRVSGAVSVPTASIKLAPGTQTGWQSAQLFCSNPWYAAPLTNIRNLALSSVEYVPTVIPNLPVSYFPAGLFPSGFALTAGNLLDTVSLPSSYTVSYDIYINSFPATFYTNIIHLAAGDTSDSTRFPGMWLDSARTLSVSFLPYPGWGDNVIFASKPIPAASWCTITVSIDAINQIMTLAVSGGVVLSQFRSLPPISAMQTTWKGIQIWASDPFYGATDAAIRNLQVSPPINLPLNYYPSAIFSEGVALSASNLLSALLLPYSYVIEFDLMPNVDCPGCGPRSIFHLTPDGQDAGGTACRVPALFFCDPTWSNSGMPGGCPPLGLHLAYQNCESNPGTLFHTTALPIGEWSTVSVAVNTLAMTISLSVASAAGVVIISKSGAIKPPQVTLPSVQLWASSPWYDTAGAQLRSLAIASPVVAACKAGYFDLDPNSASVCGFSRGTSAVISVVYRGKPLTISCVDGRILLAKIDGRKSTWTYDSGLWTDPAAQLSPGSYQFDQTEAKLAAFAAVPLQTIGAGFAAFVTPESAYAVPSVWLEVTVSSLNQSALAIMASGSFVNAGFSRSTWNDAVGVGMSGEPNCNINGINAQCTGQKCRFGLMENNENECNSCDLSMGLGCDKGPAGEAGYGNPWPTAYITTKFGYLVGTEIPGTFLGDTSNGGICFPCPLGSYRAASAVSQQCSPCQGGTYNPVAGSTDSTACLPCPAGTWSSDGASVCATIPAGYESNGASGIAACSAGKGATLGAGTCTSCAAGSFGASADNLYPPSICNFTAGSAAIVDATYNGVPITISCVDGRILLAKIDGRKSTWTYDSGLWTDPAAQLSPGSYQFDQTEAKLAAFAAVPLQTIGAGFQTFTTDSNAFPAPIPSSWLEFNLGSSSATANSVFSRNIFVNSGLPRTAWNAALGAEMNYEPNCNVNGINVYSTYFGVANQRCRFGLMENNENDCGSCDLSMGIGCLTSAAGEAGWWGGGTRLFGYLTGVEFPGTLQLIQAKCTPCPLDSYAAGAGNTVCTSCPVSTSTFGLSSTSTAFCVSRSLPLSLYAISSSPNGVALATARILGKVDLPASYSVQFDLYPTADGTADWRSIVHLSGGSGWDLNAGGRLPLVSFCGQNDRNCPSLGLTMSYIASGMQRTGEAVFYSSTALPLTAWSTVSTTIDAVNLLMSLTVSGGVSIPTQSMSFPTPSQPTWPGVLIYASDPWWVAAAAKIRNLGIAALSTSAITPTALPKSYYPALTFPSGSVITAANLLGIVALPASYAVSFDIYPTADGSGFRSILHLTASGQDYDVGGLYGKLPAVYFCSGNARCPTMGLWLDWAASGTSGSEEIVIATANALPLNQWSSVSITVNTINQLMTLTVSGGLTVPTMTGAFATPAHETNPRVQVFSSEPWSASAAAKLRTLVIAPVMHVDTVVAQLPVKYYPGATFASGFALTAGNLVGIVALPSSYAVSFDLMPTADGSDWRNIVHLTASGLDFENSGMYGRLPAVFFCQAGNCPTLGLAVLWAASGSVNNQEANLKTAALPLNQWCSVSITVDTINQLMTLTVSGGVSVPTQFVALPTPAHTTYSSVKVYASDPFYPVAGANIRNLAIAASAATATSSLPLTFYPASTSPSGAAPSQGSLLAVIDLLPTSFLFSLDVKLTADGSGWRQIAILQPQIVGLWLSSPGDPRVPYSSTLSLFVDSWSPSESYIQTSASQALALNAWSSVLITMDFLNLIMTLSVSGDTNFPTISKGLPSPSANTWRSVKLWAALDNSAAAALVRNLVVSAVASPLLVPANLPVSFFPSVTYPNGFVTYSGNLLGLITLPPSFLINFDLMVTSAPGPCTNILHLTSDPFQDYGFAYRLPGVWWCPDLLLIFHAGGSEQELRPGPASQALGKWVSFSISVDLGGRTLSISTSTTEGPLFPTASMALDVYQANWPNVYVFACDSWYNPTNAAMRGLDIVVSNVPTPQPSAAPSSAPTASPTLVPTYVLGNPTPQPSASPSCSPTITPTMLPTYRGGYPSPMPTRVPTLLPTVSPSLLPTYSQGRPTPQPSASPSNAPTASPTLLPTYTQGNPTPRPSASPSSAPTVEPTQNPTYGGVRTFYASATGANTTVVTLSLASSSSSIAPGDAVSGQGVQKGTSVKAVSGAVVTLTLPTINAKDTLLLTFTKPAFPTPQPSAAPSSAPTASPTLVPTYVLGNPTPQPSASPSCSPTITPTMLPTYRGGYPSPMPTRVPTLLPTVSPSLLPTYSQGRPTPQPSASPSNAPTASPTLLPTYTQGNPTPRPSASPSPDPTVEPTLVPTYRGGRPTPRPSASPSSPPTASPTLLPTYAAGKPTPIPSASPTNAPTVTPTLLPTYIVDSPTPEPSSFPTTEATPEPSLSPTYVNARPTPQPSASPSCSPTITPTLLPTYSQGRPTPKPSAAPSAAPTVSPTLLPSYTADSPTPEPSASPNPEPTAEPSLLPTYYFGRPTPQPSASPSNAPTASPTLLPTYTQGNPTPRPSASPTSAPTASPTLAPTYLPDFPTPQPSASPTASPTAEPTLFPTPFPPTQTPTSPREVLSLVITLGGMGVSEVSFSVIQYLIAALSSALRIPASIVMSCTAAAPESQQKKSSLARRALLRGYFSTETADIAISGRLQSRALQSSAVAITFTINVPDAATEASFSSAAVAAALPAFLTAFGTLSGKTVTLVGFEVSVVAPTLSPVVAASAPATSSAGASIGLIVGCAVGGVALLSLAALGWAYRARSSKIVVENKYRQPGSRAGSAYSTSLFKGGSRGSREDGVLKFLHSDPAQSDLADAAASSRESGRDRTHDPSRLSSTGSNQERTAEFFRVHGEVTMTVISWTKLRPLKPLGDGSFAEVFLAERQLRGGHKMNVAVKILKMDTKHAEAGAFDDAMKRLQAEFSILDAAHCDNVNVNVIKVFGAAVDEATDDWKLFLRNKASTLVDFETGRMAGIVSRFEEGGTLKEHLAKEKDNMEEKLRLLTEVATGLYHLHYCEIGQIVHGDLKPDNILLDKLGQGAHIRLIDFGLSEIKSVDDSRSSSARESSAVIGKGGGTWCYMAPELYKGIRNSRSTDMYSFGTIVWEVLAGQEPWRSITEATRIMNLGRKLDCRHQRDGGPLPDDTPSAVVELIEQCLAWSHMETVGEEEDARRARVTAQKRPKITEAKNILEAAYEHLRRGKYDIFLSYAWGEKACRQPMAQQLYVELQQRGFSVWMDIFNMGNDLKQGMREGIKNSQCIIVLLSPAYLTSINCMYELQQALESKKPIIVCIAEATGWKTWTVKEEQSARRTVTSGSITHRLRQTSKVVGNRLISFLGRGGVGGGEAELLAVMGLKKGRKPGQPASFDVFLSYRVATDAELVEKLYSMLTARGIKVWWDKKCLQAGVNWEESFCDGLVKSRAFLPILSRRGQKEIFEKLSDNSACDNVLLEYRLALEYKRLGLIERIFPVLVGDKDAATGAFGDYFKQGCHPSSPSLESTVVQAVEAKVEEHLLRQDLGPPALEPEAATVAKVLREMTVSQGGFVVGAGLKAALRPVVDKIDGMIRGLMAADAERPLIEPAGPLARDLKLDAMMYVDLGEASKVDWTDVKALTEAKRETMAKPLRDVLWKYLEQDYKIKSGTAHAGNAPTFEQTQQKADDRREELNALALLHHDVLVDKHKADASRALQLTLSDAGSSDPATLARQEQLKHQQDLQNARLGHAVGIQILEQHLDRKHDEAQRKLQDRLKRRGGDASGTTAPADGPGSYAEEAN